MSDVAFRTAPPIGVLSYCVSRTVFELAIFVFCLQWDFPFSGAILPHFGVLGPKITNFRMRKRQKGTCTNANVLCGRETFALRRVFQPVEFEEKMVTMTIAMPTRSPPIGGAERHV